MWEQYFEFHSVLVGMARIFRTSGQTNASDPCAIPNSCLFWLKLEFWVKFSHFKQKYYSKLELNISNFLSFFFILTHFLREKEGREIEEWVKKTKKKIWWKIRVGIVKKWKRRTKRWVDLERPREYHENGRKWETYQARQRRRSGLVSEGGKEMKKRKRK